MKGKGLDRLTEALALLCIAAAVFTLTLSSGDPGAGGSLADLKVQTVAGPDLERFNNLLQDARRLVDANGDPAPYLEQLEEGFAGRHEVWSLAARHWENQDRYSDALVAYARAVRLQADYLDKGSGLYLGRRIEALNARVMGELMTARDSGELDKAGEELLKTAYFIKRRLAGGCE